MSDLRQIIWSVLTPNSVLCLKDASLLFRGFCDVILRIEGLLTEVLSETHGQLRENESRIPDILTTMVKKWFWTPILGSAMVPTPHGLRRPRGTPRMHRSVTQLPKLAPPAP